MGMQKALDKLESTVEDLRERKVGSRSRFSEKLKIFSKRLQNRYPTRVASVEMGERYILSFMKWGTDKPHFWVLDTEQKQLKRPTECGYDVRALVAETAADVLYLLDEEEVFRWFLDKTSYKPSSRKKEKGSRHQSVPTFTKRAWRPS